MIACSRSCLSFEQVLRGTIDSQVENCLIERTDGIDIIIINIINIIIINIQKNAKSEDYTG